MLIYRSDMIEETAKSFAVYSKRDADAWRELKAKANMFELVMAAALYTPPAKWNPNESLPNPLLATQSSFSMFGLDEEMAFKTCLLYTSDAADERSSVDLGGRRIIKKKIQTGSSCSRDRAEHG